MTSENRHELKVLVLDAVMERAIHLFGPRYEKGPRVLAVGPAVRDSDFGAVGSAPVNKVLCNLLGYTESRDTCSAGLCRQMKSRVFWRKVIYRPET